MLRTLPGAAATGYAVAAAASAPRHLVVAVHGLLETPKSVHVIVTALRAAHPVESGVIVHASCANVGLSTTRGILRGGVRLACEVQNLLMLYPTVSKLSFVGVSLGGLYARVASAELHSMAPNLHFSNFITFATPWAGARRNGWDVLLGGSVSAALGVGGLGATGRQLMLSDADGEGGVPLLRWLADPRGAHWEAIAKFERRALVANSFADDKVPHWSAALSRASLRSAATSGGKGDAAPLVESSLRLHFHRRGIGGPEDVQRGRDDATLVYPRWRTSHSSPAHLVVGVVDDKLAREVSEVPPVDMRLFPHISAVYSLRHHADDNHVGDQHERMHNAGAASTGGDTIARRRSTGSMDSYASAEGDSLGPVSVIGTAAAVHEEAQSILAPAADAEGGDTTTRRANDTDTVPQQQLAREAAVQGSDATAAFMHEEEIISSFRRLSFLNVDVEFREVGAFLLNHVRIAASMPTVSRVGGDVVEFVVRHVFVP